MPVINIPTAVCDHCWGLPFAGACNCGMIGQRQMAALLHRGHQVPSATVTQQIMTTTTYQTTPTPPHPQPPGIPPYQQPAYYPLYPQANQAAPNQATNVAPVYPPFGTGLYNAPPAAHAPNNQPIAVAPNSGPFGIGPYNAPVPPAQLPQQVYAYYATDPSLLVPPPYGEVISTAMEDSKRKLTHQNLDSPPDEKPAGKNSDKRPMKYWFEKSNGRLSLHKKKA